MVFILGLFIVFILLCWIASECMTRSNYKNRNNPVKYSLNKQLKLISDAIDNLDGFQFESFCTYMFQLGNFKAKTTPKTNDGGKDIILKDKDGLIYVECKHYNENNKITVNLIHKLISACTVDGIRRGIFITTSLYTSSSIELVEKCDSVDIQIWYKDDLLNFCTNIDRIELLEWLGYDKDEVLKYCTI
ncbi:restriction endonuclease [Clostridium beijerinckii]|uniref:restriction endonuclease n=1 Tax=Clostridium beijerinckii TaxID=1520 RepID=UPI00156DD958|nr:restriction endonuclease [Clostridium beijerinckii]NRU52526.1 HJR/Mrr/RecB family endonuclease [Clostridium beijerinckii]NYC69405.1 HJR/Mrr/RecB family endonuclease [Clostridium beijerinckii]NYC91727.1 HJR/Mrr/RecB family endonuclease [Clostridium beijerinckii]